MQAFHSNWTRPFFVRNPHIEYRIEPFELLTTALSALEWRKENGSIRMICDTPAERYYESLGLCFLWDDGVYPLLDSIPPDSNAEAFWAAGKLYALSAVPSPCVMIDTDFICWKSVSCLLDGLDTAAIHREDITPSIYLDQSAFTRTTGFPLDPFDWTVQPFNTALAYFGNDAFRQYYTDTAIRFMRCSPKADDVLTYMVFAEQRLLAMCAKEKNIRSEALSDLPALFGGAQNGYFTHIWGFKQQMRDNPHLYEDFCHRCANRLKEDFPAEAQRIAQVKELSPFF